MSLREAVHRVEEALIALILGVMTVLTFIQVVLRYGFNSGFIWALEADFYLFSWLVMLGISYCVRVRAHIGVDAAVRMFPPPVRRVIGLVVVSLALLYAALMLYGSCPYIDRTDDHRHRCRGYPGQTLDPQPLPSPRLCVACASACLRWAGASSPDARRAMSSPTRRTRRSRTSPHDNGPTPRRCSDERRSSCSPTLFDLLSALASRSRCRSGCHQS